MECLYTAQGILTCKEKFAQMLPQGSYQETCGSDYRPCNFDGKTLSCFCKPSPEFGIQRVETSLDVSTCKKGSAILNDNGRLVCEIAETKQPSRGPCPAEVKAFGSQACVDSGYDQ